MTDTEALDATLAAIADALVDTRGRWWVIGSAAIRLHGAATSVADVDVLLGVADARRLLAAWGVAADTGGGSDRFRSTLFARIAGLPMPVEVMAGFSVRVDGVWKPVRPRSRQAFDCAGRTIFAPSIGELAGMCRRFARDKDRARLRLLQVLPRTRSA